jgi:hypothetical protein
MTRLGETEPQSEMAGAFRVYDGATTPRKLDQDMFYQSPGTLHYNTQCKSGALLNRVTARGFEGLRPGDIDWVWLVEEQRRATPPALQTPLSEPDRDRLHGVQGINFRRRFGECAPAQPVQGSNLG